jgi:hypothetical protein
MDKLECIETIVRLKKNISSLENIKEQFVFSHTKLKRLFYIGWKIRTTALICKMYFKLLCWELEMRILERDFLYLILKPFEKDGVSFDLKSLTVCIKGESYSYEDIDELYPYSRLEMDYNDSSTRFFMAHECLKFRNKLFLDWGNANPSSLVSSDLLKLLNVKVLNINEVIKATDSDSCEAYRDSLKIRSLLKLPNPLWFLDET